MRRTTLHVLDGTAMLFRAHHTAPSLRDVDGREIGALVGLLNAVFRFLRTIVPSHLAMVYDPGRPTFRHELYAAYKSNRRPTPEELAAQLEHAAVHTRALGIASFRVRGFEADDLMATLARRASEAGIRTALASPDKDVLQLLSPSVAVLDPKTLRPTETGNVVERFGVTPPQLTDYLALAGDSSDNVPGVAGVGPKAAAALVATFEDLDGIYANLHRVDALGVRGAAGLAGKLEIARSAAYLSRDLVRLRGDVPLGDEPLTVGSFRYRGPDASRTDVRALFSHFGLFRPPDPVALVQDARNL